MNVKLICLDCDGVLNGADEVQLEHSYYDLHDSKVKRLNRLIEATTEEECPTKILFTSTWRHDFTNQLGVNMFFQAVGITPVCIGLTPTFRSYRGIEILNWLIKHQYEKEQREAVHVKNLVILDDDSDMLMLKQWLVHTDFHFGLTDANVDEAIKMLHKKFSLRVDVGEPGLLSRLHSEGEDGTSLSEWI